MVAVLFMLSATLNAPPGTAGPRVLPIAAPTMIRATGVGYPPPHLRGAQARLIARRAAEVVAVRNLAIKAGFGTTGTTPAFRYVSYRNLAGGAVEVTVESTVTARRR